MMRKFLVLFASLALANGAVHPRKDFHDHFFDFMEVIQEEAGENVRVLMDEYLAEEDFAASFDYLRTQNFKNLVLELEELPEFFAVMDFLEQDNIDIHFFIDALNEMLEVNTKRERVISSRRSGNDFTSYVNDMVALYPKEKLAALYEEKMATDEIFANSMENLTSDEFQQIWKDLWESSTFQAEVKTLQDNRISVQQLVESIEAIFGQ